MSETHEIKMFSVPEANQLLPKLAGWIGELQKLRGTILAMEVEIDMLELVTGKDDSGVSPAIDTKVDAYNRLVSRFYALVEEIHSTGCFLKDLDMGLVDFYTLYKNRVVYLCWKLGESEIRWWHDIGCGYGSRQLIES